MLSAGVLASAFTYGLAYRLSGSRLGAALAGVVYGCGGFLVQQLPHVAIIHTAAWIPLVLWSLEELRHRFHRGWVVALALAVAHLILAGHTQEAAYGLGLTALFIAVGLPRAPAGWRSFGAAAALGIVLGLGLTAPQLLPTAEFIRLTDREHVDYLTFTLCNLPKRQLPMLLYPYAYGGGQGLLPHASVEGTACRVPYFGEWCIAEIGGFCGLLSLVLAVAGFLGKWRTRGAWLWGAVAVAAVLLALGKDIPVSRLLFQVPLVNKFRCIGRLIVVFNLAVAVLAAWGTAALRELPRRRGALALAAATAGVAAALAVGWWTVRRQIMHGTYCPFPLPRAMARSVLSPLPWVNPELGRPIALFAVGLLAVWAWFLRPGRVAAALLALVLAADVTQIGCHNQMGFVGTHGGGALRRTPPALEAVRADMARSGERLLSYDHGLVFAPCPPPVPDAASCNMTTLWGLTNVEGYGPLLIRRQRVLLDVVGRERIAAELLGIRYKVCSDCLWRPSFGLKWPCEDFRGMTLGPARLPSTRRFGTPPTPATQLALLTVLGNATSLPDGTVVAEITVHTTDGDLPMLPVRVGEHVAEACCDRPDVRRIICHYRPPLSRDTPAPDGSFCLHDFLAVFPLGYRSTVTGVDIRWVGPPSAVMSLCGATLVDETTRECHPILELMADADAWQVLPTPPGSRLIVARCTLPLKRAWLVDRVIALPPDQVAAVLLEGAPLPDGTPFRPYETALVEQPVPIELSAGGEAEITAYQPCRVTVRAQSKAGGLLVLGDVYYPGWRATVDGRPAKVYQTDYVLRGVVVPAGEHVVEFRFRPTKFYVGAAVAALSAALLLGLLVAGRLAAALGAAKRGG